MPTLSKTLRSVCPHCQRHLLVGQYAHIVQDTWVSIPTLSKTLRSVCPHCRFFRSEIGDIAVQVPTSQNHSLRGIDNSYLSLTLKALKSLMMNRYPYTPICRHIKISTALLLSAGVTPNRKMVRGPTLKIGM